MKGVQSAQVLQVDREEKDAPEEGERNQHVGDTAGQEGSVGKQAQVN